MPNISAAVRLRPIRFAFIVRPDDLARVTRIFQTNSCLWGGRFNPIVPYVEKLPAWWDRHGHRFETGLQVMNGYLDFFEPDFLVEAEAGLASKFGYAEDRILQLDDILTDGRGNSLEGHGLSVLDIYTGLYQKQFQFVQRDARKAILPRPSRSMRAFSACVFGDFPSEERFKYFSEAFTDCFSPVIEELTGESLAEAYRDSPLTVLKVGRHHLDVNYHERSDPALFVLDASKPRDLIDFWNLRTIRQSIIAVPLQWLTALSAFCREFIAANYRPIPQNPHGVMIHPTVMFSRSIPTEQIEGLFEEHFRVDIEGANCRQDWYPPIWRPSSRHVVRTTPPTLSAEEKTFETQYNDDALHIRFETLAPEFANKYGGRNRWANIVQLKDWTFNNRVATAFPCDYRNPKFPDFQGGGDSVIPTTEGLAFFPHFKGIGSHWSLSDGTTAIRAWLKASAIEADLSDAGRATQQIIQTLGGFAGVRSIAHPEIVKLLNRVSRTPVAPALQFQRLQNEIKTATTGDIWHRNNAKVLVERGAVTLGMRIRCLKCSNWSWYAIDQLNYEVKCSLCMKTYAFPVVEPTSSKNTEWAYRLSGPFALPDYARGGYAAALSIRFFSACIGFSMDTAVTWSAGQVLKFAEKDSSEVDFLLWYQKKAMFGRDHKTDLIFGEAKSFRGESPDEKRSIDDAFSADDVDRMKTLALKFPGSVFVFSTMKRPAEMSKAEIERISRFAEWGRGNTPDRQRTRAAVVVLTGVELFCSHNIQSTWRDLGGRHAQLTNEGYVHLDNLRVLADITQQLYLGMPSYWDWLEAKMLKRKARAARRATAPALPNPAGEAPGEAPAA